MNCGGYGDDSMFHVNFERVESGDFYDMACVAY